LVIFDYAMMMFMKHT